MLRINKRKVSSTKENGCLFRTKDKLSTQLKQKKKQ